MPQVGEQIIEVPKMAEQILDVLVPEMVEQLVKQPKTIPQDRIQQRTVEHITADTPVPQDVEGTSRVSSRLSLRTGFNCVSEDRSLKTLLLLSLRRSIIEMPVTQFTDKVVDILVLAQRQISMVQPVQKTIEIPTVAIL